MRREYIAWFDMPNNGKLHGQSVMPQQELIRCKDCKHFTGKWCILNSRKEFDPEDRLVNGEGFCAWAERKEE